MMIYFVIKAAKKAVMPSVPWQRCQFHLQQNAQSYITKKSKNKSSILPNGRSLQVFRTSSNFLAAFDTIADETLVPDRIDYANGFKPKRVKTRIGELNLSIPQTRSSDFYPNCLEKGLRSERALNIALGEMYVGGVSTRKVSKIIESMCGTSVSSAMVSNAAKKLDEVLNTFY
jgi:transposase-like protein